MRATLKMLTATFFLLAGSSACLAALRPTPSEAPGPPASAENVSTPPAEPAPPSVPIRQQKLEILGKIAAGALSPEAALEELEKVDAKAKAKSQWISIEISEEGRHDSVRMSIPISLGEWGLRMAAQQGRQMLEAVSAQEGGRPGQRGPQELELIRQAVKLLELPDSNAMIQQIVEALREAEPGHALLDLRDGNDRLRISVE